MLQNLPHVDGPPIVVLGIDQSLMLSQHSNKATDV